MKLQNMFEMEDSGWMKYQIRYSQKEKNNKMHIRAAGIKHEDKNKKDGKQL